VCCFPPCGVSPRGVWGLCPLRSSDDAFSMMMSPHAEPTSGCSAPDSGWQSAAARPGTTLSVLAPGRPPGHRHIYWPISIATYKGGHLMRCLVPNTVLISSQFLNQQTNLLSRPICGAIFDTVYTYICGCEGDTSTHAQGTDPKVALGA